MLPDEFRERRELFTGEHVFPWMFEDYGALAPLREAAELLAEHEWPRLYDEEVLARNDVPAAAAIYAEDPYVAARFSEETAGPDARAAAVGHQRVRAQRAARRRRAHPRAACSISRAAAPECAGVDTPGCAGVQSPPPLLLVLRPRRGGDGRPDAAMHQRF